MTIKTEVDLKAAFENRERAHAQAPEVPERIKNHAPAPVLRPGGSWKARADAVDQRVREAHDAEKAKNEWAARLRPGHRRGKGMGMAFRRSASDDQS